MTDHPLTEAERRALPPGTPLGIEGHLPFVPQAAGVPPWCSCGYRWDPRDPDSLLVGEHIAAEAKRLGVPNGTHRGYLR